MSGDFFLDAITHSLKGVKAMISLGGWGGSRFFSSNMATPANRTAFVKTVINFATKYKFDGVDLEYVLTVQLHTSQANPQFLIVGNIQATKALVRPCQQAY